VDEWLSRYTACDQAYLLHYYRVGEKRNFCTFWREDVPRVWPKAIPPFTPTKRVFRMDGIVI
jgi:hypothetical protein